MPKVTQLANMSWNLNSGHLAPRPTPLNTRLYCLLLNKVLLRSKSKDDSGKPMHTQMHGNFYDSKCYLRRHEHVLKP